jgi:lipopolysaccharide export system protein LptC
MKYRVIFSILAVLIGIGSYFAFHSSDAPQQAAQQQPQAQTPAQAAPQQDNSMSSFKIDNK